MKSLCAVFKVHISMREWLSGGVSPCQGEGRGFESRLALLKPPEFNSGSFLFMILGSKSHKLIMLAWGSL